MALSAPFSQQGLDPLEPVSQRVTFEFPDDGNEEDPVPIDQGPDANADYGNSTLVAMADRAEQCVSSLRALEGVTASALNSTASQAEKIASLQVSVHAGAVAACDATAKTATLRKLRDAWFFVPVRDSDAPSKKQARVFAKKQKAQRSQVYDAQHDADRLNAANDARMELAHRSRVASETAAARRKLLQGSGGSRPDTDNVSSPLVTNNTTSFSPLSAAIVVGTSSSADAQLRINDSAAQMSASLARIKEAATVLGGELDRQNKALGDIAWDADEAAVRVKVAQRDIRRVLRE
jgi:hypothetical protein